MLMKKHIWVWTCTGCGQQVEKVDNQPVGGVPLKFGPPSGWFEVEHLGSTTHYCNAKCLGRRLRVELEGA